ncbi:unnamed protein product [Nesidiocoris tenuis]|uniref:RRM domain-containing protein n=1 Tax=Nesidiocoris tenuis TaxID=355587 RepID=A0A6H5FZS6_9HEMI|nr:unnamed protein product [Nesidiocoris tenuis]CAA9995103.1 unnamed protein product [Nesidiocoris tenuis]
MRGDYDRNGGGGSDVRSSAGTRVYVGGIGQQVKKDDLEVEFAKYGSISSVWVAYNPPGFAFVEFAERHDAEAACDRLNNAKLFGARVRVEISRGRRSGGGGRGGQSRDGRRNDRDGGGGRRGGGGGSSDARGSSYGSSARYSSSDSYSARRYRSRSPTGSRGGGGGGGGGGSGEGSGSSSRYR